jgi:large subunit ribosomal protein L10
VLKTDKERIVEELAAQLGSVETLIVADYRGLTNKQLEGLRDQLLEHGARFRIVKNTLTRRAAEQAGAAQLLEMLEGPTAIAFVESAGDPAAVAKALAATAKTTNVLTLRGGILEGKALSGEEVSELATLPPVDVLRGQVVGVLVAPVTQLVALLSAPLQDLYGLIEARIKQLEEQGDASASAAATADTEETSGEEAQAPSDEPAAELDESASEPAAQDVPAESGDAEPPTDEAGDETAEKEEEES